MKKPIHGGGVDRAMAELSLPRASISDFSASINPLGMPPEVRQAVTTAIERIGDYPEIEATSLRRELALFHNLAEENLLPGSGSTELIYLLPRVFRPRRALLVLPCFSEYAPALQQVDCRIDSLCLLPEEDFAFSVERVLESVTTTTDLVLLANPGNPTGIAVDPQLLLQLAEQLGECRLLIDEAFADFCPESSLLDAVPQHPNLLILHSLTKFYAIPGLRAGYLAGPQQDIARLAAAREPWSLSNLAIAAAKACIHAEGFRSRTLQLIPQLRADLQQGLEGLGLKVFASAANYLLCRLPEGPPSATQIAAALRRQGLLIRSCTDFEPLDDRYLRVAVLGIEQNGRLLQELSRVVDSFSHRTGYPLI